MDEVLQKLCVFFGWFRELQMLVCYVWVVFEDCFLLVWNDVLDERVDVLRVILFQVMFGV